ncbi:major paralogous domain-containing protein [Cyclonatronum proteinivorum]|uniref:Major paralogous domain-containing protein n=1 Tax=Cyclonatronum proteinivorum TaxID=1457365 RepID=A0A345UL34_9BACT|nr:FISUMP domain-containing protein [Cyclonatronum proteinivorum]AXJ01186.1 major paralogous domain-containing protein [Cyclonatronum proteinivorum]
MKSTPSAVSCTVALLLFFSLLIAESITPQLSHAQDLRRLDVERIASNRVAVFQDYTRYAAVIVESSVPNLRINSTLGIVADLSEPAIGVYRVIIEPRPQILTFEAPGFMQTRIGTGPLQARQVVEFTAKPQSRSENLISVIFNVTPADARIAVDGELIRSGETVALPAGTREVQIEREGYRAISDFVEVSERNIQFNYRLDEIDIVPVRIRSNVEGARVVIDGTERGEIDRSGTRGLFLYPGSYALQLTQTGFVSQSRTIVVSEEGDNEFTVNLTRNIGELALTVTPADATVLINREEVAGQRLLELAPGRYRLEIEKEHYEPLSETIDIALNERLSRDITLQAHTGSLQFNVTPGDARVELIDATGRTVNEWNGLSLLRNVKAGPYTLRATAEGHLPEEQQIVIVLDETLRVSILMEEGFIGACRSTTITDIDGNTYRTVSIGDQCWMAENLNTSRYRDGSAIPNVRGNTDWTRLNSGAWAYYRNRRSNGRTYGKLYNWHAVNDRRGLCPEGWRVPSDRDWTILEDNLGGRNIAGGKLKSTGTQHWRSPNTGATNESAFSALPGGWRSDNIRSFSNLGSNGLWWSSSEDSTDYAWLRVLDHGDASVSRGNGNKGYGFSVRCVGD